MTRTGVCLKLAIALSIFALVLGAYGPLPAQQNPESSLDVVVKISKVEDTLNLVDELVTDDTGQPKMSPTAMLRGMLHGTEWIDPRRSIVIGIELIDGQRQIALLIPFQYPNKNFQAAYNASSGPNYYIMALPPGQGTVISGAIERAMVVASTSKEKALLSVELAASKLLSKADHQIKQGLDKLESVPQAQGAPHLGPTPEELRTTLVSVIDFARQLEVLTLGLDIDREELSYSFGVAALPETRLAKVFSEGGKTSLLDNYKPKHQINFRSRSFDMEGVMGLIEECFGELYAGMGLDFSALAAICKSFTGETAGGMSFGKESMSMEAINVLKEPKGAPEFLEKVYVPWMMKYSQDMAAMVEKNLGIKIESPFVRTQDSTISGYKVIGIKTQFPVFHGPKSPKSDDASSLMTYESRVTTVGGLLLTAHSDERMADLIEIAKTFKERPAEGPLMRGDIDMGGYLSFLAGVMPEMAGEGRVLPKLGRLTFVVDLREDRADSRVSVKMEDAKKMLAFFSKAAATVSPPPAVAQQEDRAIKQEEAPAARVKEKKAVVPTEESPQYWLNKGALCATYGNDKGAIKYFKKAIELDPKNGSAHFQLGISYGELGRYEDGLSHVNKALEFDPGKGLYLYGRGRLYLLAGQKSKAIDDFKEAAALGQQDARDYLLNYIAK